MRYTENFKKQVVQKALERGLSRHPNLESIRPGFSFHYRIKCKPGEIVLLQIFAAAMGGVARQGQSLPWGHGRTEPTTVAPPNPRVNKGGAINPASIRSVGKEKPGAPRATHDRAHGFSFPYRTRFQPGGWGAALGKSFVADFLAGL